MPNWSKIAVFLYSLALLFAVTLQPESAFSQDSSARNNVDPRLVEIVSTINQRSSANTNDNRPRLRAPEYISDVRSKAENKIAALNEVRAISHTRVPANIRKAINKFENEFGLPADPSLANISILYNGFADLLEQGASLSDQQDFVLKYTESGNWIENHYAHLLLGDLKVISGNRQSALQTAQKTLLQIPTVKEASEKGPSHVYFADDARAAATNAIARLHNVQGNIDLAIETTLNYLEMTKSAPTHQGDVDLINNLIFSHSLARDNQSMIYLGESLVEIEKSNPSDVPGLSELRIAQAMNSVGRFQEGLSFADKSLEKLNYERVVTQANTVKAISLAGLGQKSEARRLASANGANLSTDYLLTEETRREPLYLGFLLALGSDNEMTQRLYNRQLDVMAGKFFANNSRDTTTMLAELENSRERQEERAAAAAREAALQALTIDRQRKLNRVLMLLLCLALIAIVATALFARYRGVILEQLRIKTREAASAEKLKTEFLGMISHELRTPLNGIIGISDYLANYHKDPDIRQKTGIVLRSGNELLSVVESLTDMARIDAGQMEILPEDADLASGLKAVVEEMRAKAEAKGLDFTSHIDPAFGIHFIDADRAVQCVDVLLSNAISFTDEGQIHVHITAEKNEFELVSGLKAVVTDTGRGMTDLVKSRLFTPFMQADTTMRRNHMGTGLSLAIARALARMMGGDITVESQVGHGAEFTLTLAVTPAKSHFTKNVPIAAQPEAEAELEPDSNDLLREEIVLDSAQGPRGEFIDLMQPFGAVPALHALPDEPLVSVAPQRILIVDDMETNRDVLRLLMESAGHSCLEASDGAEALDLLAVEDVDLVILDIHMAGMDGVDMLRCLRALKTPYAEIPVIALTADNAASTNAACMAEGADIFLTKPARPDEIEKAIAFLHSNDAVRQLSRAK